MSTLNLKPNPDDKNERQNQNPVALANQARREAAHQHGTRTEEQKDIEQKRAAYAKAVEGREGGVVGKVKEIISKMRGGKFSKDGELRMAIDAEREDKLRSPHGVRDDAAPGEGANLHDKYQNSYLKYKEVAAPKSANLWDMVGPEYAVHEKESGRYSLSGVIDGKAVEITTIGHNKGGIEGSIGGEKISAHEATRIWNEYWHIANTQGKDIDDFHENRKREKITQ